MLTDVDKEFDTPEIDEDGELIETIEIEEAFEDVDNAEPTEQENYDGEDDDIALESEDEEFDDIQEVTVEAKENFENAKDRLVEIFTSILENGEITEEDNTEIEQLKEQYTQAYNDIKENTEVIQKKTLEERVQELSDGMIGASTDEILAILTDSGRKPWLYKDEDGNVLMDGTAIPELTILVQKLNLIATDGENEGEIQLSPGFINLIATSTIVLSAKNINLDGYISNSGGNFAIDEQGNAKVNDLSVKGEFSCESLSLETLNSPKYPQSLDSSMNIYVNASTGDDEATLEDGATFKTIMGALDSIPKNLNAKTINISLKTDVTDDVNLDWFMCGRIRIFFEGHTLYGNYSTYRAMCTNALYGGTVDDWYGNTGSIMPYVGRNIAGMSTSVANYGSIDFGLYNLNIYGAKNLASGCTESIAVGCEGSGGMYTRAIKVINCDNGFRANARGEIYDDSSSGKANRYGFMAVSGGRVGLSNGVHTGGSIDSTYESSGGEVKKHGATFDETSSSGSNTSNPPTITTKKVAYSSTSGNTWRTTYSSWRNDGQVIEGNGYGSGNCRGYWFFGSQFGQIKGCTEVSTVALKVKRAQLGSWGSSSTLKLAYHNYSSKPSSPSAPTYFASVSIPAYSGDYVSFTITNQTVLDGIKNGTIKGFGLYDSNYGTYVGCSGSAKVEITYKE